ncbi:GAP family protein [Demequina activiva]|uniref:Membrane protein n=1 Tax=Demequina activiva TaxID=1582364 RepID=A0A919Q1M7_9MICO|nr:GAP family protein [Demequina activiva]GIG54241.1 membrane protein [Demequina activiva]
MNGIIGEVLPLALGVAISPIPIIASILMLLSPRARVTSVGFLLGWVLGILIATTIFTLLAGSLGGDHGGSSPVVGIIQIVLAALLLLLALKQWRSRPRDGAEPTMPAWMSAIDTFTFAKAAGLGFLLSGVNPKNLLLAASAGLTIGTVSATSPSSAAPTAIAVFTVLAASTVAVPVIGYLIAADRLRGPLDRLRDWLAGNNAVIMTVLVLVIGVVLLGKGIAQF